MTSEQPYSAEPTRSPTGSGRASGADYVPAAAPSGIPPIKDDDAATRIIPVFQDPPPSPPTPVYVASSERTGYRRGRTVMLHRTKNVASRSDAAGYLRFKLRERRRQVADRVRTMHARHGSRRLKVLSTLIAFAIVAVAVGAVYVVGPGRPQRSTANASSDWGGDVGTAVYGNPFAGTPADGFPEGAAGIVAPSARSIAGWPSQRVSAALALVTQALIDTRISPTLVRDHNPADFFKLIAPRQQDALQRELDSGVAAAYISQLANGVTLISSPRAKGTMTYHTTTNAQGTNLLEITSSFVWVYPVAPTAERPNASLIVVHDRVVWQIADPATVPASDVGLWLGDAQSYAANVDCDTFAAGFLAPTAAAAATNPVLDTPDLFQPGAEMNEPTC